ncbi:MAG: hypothetical protein SFV32_08990 [Opitutaceae bacterium]|nr:hypothetical protein [Opitutaceae bacterium]
MKFPRLANWLATLCFCSVAVIPFLPQFREAHSPYVLTFQITSDHGGTAQLFWDEGAGATERTSSRANYAAGEAVPVRLLVPARSHRMLRLDPADRPGKIALSRIQIVDTNGATVHRFSPDDFKPVFDIRTSSVQGDNVAIEVSPGANDPQLAATFNQPLELASRNLDWPLRTGLLFAISATAMLLLRWLRPEWRRDVRRGVNWASNTPRRLILLVALAATVASTYPVLILGHSFVSPNNEGAPLLYERWPTLPGYNDSRIYSQRGTDVGAILWQHIPYSVLHGDALLEGSLPLWNRYNSCGTTMLGQGQSMFGDPLLLPVMLAQGASWAWDLRFVFARWLFCVGLGGCAWLVSRGKGATALVTFAGAFVGFFLYRLNHPAIFSFSYAPAVLFSWMWLACGSGRRQQIQASALLLLTSAALLCSGTVKEAYMLFVTMNLAGALYLVSGEQPWQAKRSQLTWAAIAGLLIIFLTAPSWLVFLLQLKAAYTGYNVAQAAQIQPGMMLGLFDELFYRPLNRNLWVFNPSMNWLFLVGAALLVVRLREALGTPGVRGLLLACVLPAALVFGVVPREWIIRVPFLANVAHVDNSFSCGLIILLAVLSGWAFARWSERVKSGESKGDLVLATLVVLVPVALWLGFCQSVHRSVYGDGITFSPLSFIGGELAFRPFIWWSLLSLLLATVVGLWLASRVLANGRASGAEAVLLSLCLATMLWRNGVHPRSTGFEIFTNQLGPRVNFSARSKAVETVQAGQAKEPSRALGLKANLFPGWNSFLRIEGINGPDALVNPYYRELVGASTMRRIWDWRIDVSPEELPKALRFLDFLNVRYYLDFKSDQALLGAALKPVRMGDLDVYESPAHWPRAFFTNRIVEYNRVSDLARAIDNGDGRPFAAVQSSDLRSAQYSATTRLISTKASGGRVEAAMQYRLKANSTEFAVEASGPGLAVLTEVWHRKDFRASVDGKEVPVLRVNHAFRGVFLPSAGIHRVKIWYHPRGYTESRILCLLGLLGVGAGFVIYRKSPELE